MPKRMAVETFKRWIELMKHIDGEKSVWQIAQDLGWRPNTVYDYVDDLQKLGLVEVKTIPGAPPRNVPVLTEKGRCILKCLQEVKQEKEAD